MPKTMSLRLDSQQAAELEAIARAEEVTISDAVRDAIDTHIEAKKNDREFQDRLQRLIKEEQGVFDRLAR